MGTAVTQRDRSHEVDILLHKATRAISPQGRCPDDGVLLALFQGELSEARADEMNAHVGTCVDCRAMLAELATPVPEALYARLEKYVLPHRRRWHWPAAMVAAAAAMVMVLPRVGVEDRSESPSVTAPAGMPPYLIEGPYGGIAHQRATLPTPVDGQGSSVFTAGSRISFRVAPVEELVGAGPTLRIYTRLGRRQWRSVPAPFATAGEGGGFWVEAPARALFGEIPGLWEVHLVLVPSNRKPPDPEPASMAEAQTQMPSAQWHVFKVDYRGTHDNDSNQPE